MMLVFEFTVQDRPAPQGSKRHVGHGVMIEMSPHVKPWREAVKEAALVRKEAMRPGDGPVFTGPVELTIRFFFRRPKAHYGTGRNADVLKPNAPTSMPIAPDLSKLIRSIEDAITTAQIWADDKQVVRVIADKLYSDTGFEGAEITIKGKCSELGVVAA